MIGNISCRVPWHDNGWNGTVCKKPEKNQSCRRCRAIYESIDLEKEKLLCGKYFSDISGNEYLKRPCVREGACFMCNRETLVTVKHPYSYGFYFNSLEETKEIIPKFSYPLVPFRWLRKKFSDTNKDYLRLKTRRYGLDVNFDDEDRIARIVKEYNKGKDFELNWMNEGKNQKAIFDYINSNIIPNKSLMFFYCKQVPFIEKNNRVLIGVGHAAKVNDPIQYNRKSSEGIDSAYLWETMIEHSIRYDECKDGFIFPFDQILKKQKDDLKFDINKAVVLIDDDYFEDFSYKSELISADAAINTLYKIKESLEYCEDNNIEFCYNNAFSWINNEIKSAWKNRGYFPGLGSLLCAYNVDGGYKIANQIKDIIKDASNFWSSLDDLFEKDLEKLTLLSIEKKSLTSFIKNQWSKIYKQKSKLYLFDLLARIDLSFDQMENIVEVLKNDGCLEEVIENPYMLYELTLDEDEKSSKKIRLKQLDYAFCRSDDVEYDDSNILNKNIIIYGANDKRRIRAYILDILIKESINGNTVYPIRYLVEKINGLRLDVSCNISLLDILDEIDENKSNFYEQSGKCKIIISNDTLNEKYFKLTKYVYIDDIISDYCIKSLSKNNNINVDWSREYDKYIKEQGFELNEDWKKEDIIALEKLSKNKISILTGGAGTGKTSILSILCNESQINKNGILLLAPTGKAAVRMRQSIGLKSYTLASFLSSEELRKHKSKLYDDGKYLLANDNIKHTYNINRTIIIDECSMLTEDMLGAVLSYIDFNIDRLILVGDYNQLPPIGAGRPFFDIIQYLKDNEKYQNQNFIELFYNKRQLGMDRLDVDFANCFKYENNKASEVIGSILERIKNNKNDFVSFSSSNDADFDDVIKQNLVKATYVNNDLIIKEERYMKDAEDIEGFNRSIGKNLDNPWFNVGCASFVDNWQIISPIRGKNIGVQNINFLIHSKYKDEGFIQRNKYHLPGPSGPEHLVYGEKVIQIINQNRQCYPKGKYDNYVANGEIGITCKYNKDSKYNNFNVEFSHKEDVTYSYYQSEIESEDTIPLELAYALTVHKCQGSQFKNVVAVLKKDCGMLSKELIYTALTRQEDKLFIIGDDNLEFLKEYLSNTHSELASRFTGLFNLPDIIEYEDMYFQKGLIHIGDGGKLLRSKSEVIIWNKLYALRDKFITVYEERFADNQTLPDFVIKDENGEIKFIWEHLGFLKDKNYMRRWKEKESIYNKYGYSKEKGNLIITSDNNTAINSNDINEKIKYVLNNI